MGSLVCLSFDVEEWDSPVIFGVESEHSMSDEFSARGCRALIDLFDKHGIKATFFITGVFARNYPDMVKELASRGHDVGCHGNEHTVLSGLTRDGLKTTIKAGLESVEGAAGMRCSGFRSPRNMINPHLFDVLGELSVAYDSSVHPAVLPGRPFDVLQRSDIHNVGGVLEVPMSTLLGLPISWWWMRNIGLWYTIAGCEASLALHGYALLYFHPWEFTALPDVKGLPRHITNRVGAKSLEDIERLIVHFKRRGCGFGTIGDIIRQRSD